jgi:histidyl-tRNA synthetase
MSSQSNAFSTQPYKGTRDFYPVESFKNEVSGLHSKAKQSYIFDTFRKVLIQWGFQEYSTSLIEHTELFREKSGDELADRALYHFVDKGERNIALRPELTPSLARIISDQFGNLKFPLRWFSIDNCFRYERPQKGRLREFWQVEVDVVGLEAGGIEGEIMALVCEMFKAFGAKAASYTIKYNHRKLLDEWIETNGWSEQKQALYGILDDWFKLSDEQQKAQLSAILPLGVVAKIIDTVNQEGEGWQEYQTLAKNYPELTIVQNLLAQQYPDVQTIFTPAIIRGQAYYTGLIFECFDMNSNNPRSLFGGGRFDNLLELFGKHSPAIGFAPGEVPFGEFLENWGLYPDFTTRKKAGIMLESQESLVNAYHDLIPKLKAQDYIIELDYQYDRSENKRYESLKKRGCDLIGKI